MKLDNQSKKTESKDNGIETPEKKKEFSLTIFILNFLKHLFLRH